MAKALSVDLRRRVIAAIEDGASCRQAAARFGVSVSSAIRWHALTRAVGDATPGPQGGDRRSGRIEAHAAVILGAVERKSDITLADLRAELAGDGIGVSVAGLWRFFARHGHTRKNVWPTPSARVCWDSVLACINVSGLRVEPWPRWIARASGLIKTAVSSITFLTRLSLRGVNRYAICHSPPQTS